MPLPDVHLGHCGTFDLWLRDVGGVHKLHYDNGGGLVAFADAGSAGATLDLTEQAAPVAAPAAGHVTLWAFNKGTVANGDANEADYPIPKFTDAAGREEWAVNLPNLRRMKYDCLECYSTLAQDIAPFNLSALNTGTVTKMPGEAGHPGVARLNSHASNANSGYEYLLGPTSSTLGVMISGGEVCEVIFKTPADITTDFSTIVFAGYHDVAVAGNTVPTVGVYFRINAGGAGEIQGECAKTAGGASVTATATHYHLANSTWYRAKLVVAQDASSALFILYSAAGVVLWSDTVAADIPTTEGCSQIMYFRHTNPAGSGGVQYFYLDALAYYGVKDNR